VFYYPRSGSLQVRENDVCDFVVYYIWIKESSCIVSLHHQNEDGVLYYGFIASFFG
jgi:hypothetical protein